MDFIARFLAIFPGNNFEFFNIYNKETQKIVIDFNKWTIFKQRAAAKTLIEIKIMNKMKQYQVHRKLPAS